VIFIEADLFWELECRRYKFHIVCYLLSHSAVWQLSNNKFPENAEFHSPTEKHLVHRLPTFDFCFSYTHVYIFVRQET